MPSPFRDHNETIKSKDVERSEKSFNAVIESEDVVNGNFTRDMKTNHQYDPKLRLSNTNSFEYIEPPPLDDDDDHLKPPALVHQPLKGEHLFLSDANRKDSLSDVSDDSNLLVESKKDLTHVTPKTNPTGYFTVGNSHSNIFVLKSEKLNATPPQLNTFDRLLGPNHSVSPKTFFSIHDNHQLLGNGLSSSDILTNSGYAAAHNFPNFNSNTIGQQSLIMPGFPTHFPFANGVQTLAYRSNNPPGLALTVNPEGVIHPIVQVVSLDSDNAVSNVIPNASSTMQKPKKWVRWTEEEDNYLRMAVDTVGEHNFKMISHIYFRGSRTELQCKNRWRKALQPGLVKGNWTKEEDEIIKRCVESGNTKWAEIASMIPGRIGEQVKERWMNVVDPNMKKGTWSDEEMSMLIAAQKELGNKWSEIAKRIPGRSEQSVKNRWYNQITSDERAKKRAEKDEREAYQRAQIKESDLPPLAPNGILNESSKKESSPDSPPLIFTREEADV